MFTEPASEATYGHADAIEAVLAADPAKGWTPSAMGRRVHLTTGQAAAALRWMAANAFARADERGAWTRYYAR